MCVNNEFKSRANRWIRCAISRNVEEVDFRLWNGVVGPFSYGELWDVPVGQEFTYEDELFFNTSCITRMTLSFCRFNPPNGAISWERLDCLCLLCADLDEDMIERILCGSPCVSTKTVYGGEYESRSLVTGVGPLSGKGPRVIVSADVSILPQSVFVRGGATGAALKENLDAICAKYFVPEEVHPQLPSSDATMHERLASKVGMYTRFFDYANYRILFSTLFVSVLTHFRIPFSQLSVFGSAKWVPLAGGKSPGVLNKLLQDSRLSVEQGVTALPTLPFITSSVTASPLEEGGDHTDSVTGPSLRSVAASARFVVLSDSSHHSATNSAGPEGDSFVRSVVPVMTEATTVTTIATTVAIPADVGKDKSVPHPSVFGSSSSSEKTDRTLSLFTGRSGSGFAAGSIRAEEVTDAGLEEIYVPEWTVTKGFEFNDGRSCANMIDHFTPPAFFKTVR
ncbi:hypothetical protein Tco_1367419 [Tanacetum coccineum]